MLRAGGRVWTLAVVLVALPLVVTPSAQAAPPFFAPVETSGSLQVKLYPTEGIGAGTQKLVTFGVPFPRGSVTVADLSKVRVLKGGVEIPAYVGQATPWRHATNASLDGTSVRVARIQVLHTLSVTYPSFETITVEWGQVARGQNVGTYTDPRSAWHLVTSGTYVASDNVYEPDVYAVLPVAHLAKGLLRPMRMDPLEPTVAEARVDPFVSVANWPQPRYLEQEHASVNFFYSIINQDDSRVTVANQNPYKTDSEPWLYDRASSIYTLYFRSGFFKALREAVRAAEFYRTQLYPAGTQPTAAVGAFRLKNPDPAGYIGSNGTMYSYDESLAYQYWLTGDPQALTAIPWIVNCHELSGDEPVRWSPGAGAWTERHNAFRLLASLVAYEVLGDATYKNNVTTYTGDFIWHQNGGGGAIPANRVDGGLYHYGDQHGDGTPDQLVASSWMSVLLQDVMVRAYAVTEDPSIAAFVRRMGTFFQAATKTDTGHLYDTGALPYPDYMMRYDGASDERDGTECEHSLEVSSAAAWAAYFAELTGQSSTAFRQSSADLFGTYKWGVAYWTRPSAPASGYTAYRVNPPRKYGWEYRTSGSLSWSLSAGTAPTSSLSASSASVTEGNSGTANAVFTVTLSPAASGTVTVNYATSNGTATAGSDYTAASGTLTFAAGETSKTVSVAVAGDTTVEGNETFSLNLSGATNATIAAGQGVGTIIDDDVALLAMSINDISLSEGNAGTTNAVLTVTLSGPAPQTITVNYATANGTAAAGSDYTAQSGNLTFTTGQASKAITVLVNGDTVVEPTETFVVNLSSPVGATLADGQGQVTITNDDTAPLPTLVIGDVTVTEGNSGTVNARFTVTLSAASASAVAVAYATADGTAGAGSDYAAKSGTLTFAAGTTQQFVDVTVNGDTTVESTETFFVNLSGPSGATIADGQGLGTITNDDTAPLPTLAIGDVTVTEGNSGTVNARFTVTLSAASASAVTVAYATADGTAGAGSDYAAKSGTLTFAAGTTQQFVDVTVNGDTTVESTETFFVNLSSPAGATIADAQGQGTITNDDTAPVGSLTIGDVSVTEGNSGTVNARFTVTLSGTGTSAITVAYATANGTGTAGSDYVAKSGTLTFPAGTTQQFVDVTVNGDTTVESNETFFVNLSSPSGATIADGQGQGTIVNDDAAPPPVPTLAIGDVTVAEGNSGSTIARFSATLSAASGSAVTVAYATANGTATAGSDYVATSGTLTFAAGTTQQTVDVTVNGDTTVEPNETFVVNLSSPSGATIADSQGQATITNDDTAAASGVPGDFNGDGQGDLLWHHQQTGDLYTWFMNGVSAASASYLTPSRFADVKWQIRGLADFNGDGRTDVLWHHQKTGELYVWMLNGTVTTAGSYLNPKSFSDTNWQIRATVDFNKDGKPDILWHHQKTGDLYVWFMNGTQVTSGAYLNPSRFADTKWQIRGTLDPNKDGDPDILWHHQGTGDLYLWFMKGTTAVSGIYLTPSRFTDTRWQIVRACDFNKDGTTDLLWHHQASGQLYVWYMTGTTATGGAYLNPPAFADVNWKVMPR